MHFVALLDQNFLAYVCEAFFGLCFNAMKGKVRGIRGARFISRGSCL